MYLISKHNKLFALLLISVCMFFSNASLANNSENSKDTSNGFSEALSVLKSKSYKKKEVAIKQLVATKDERVKKILEAMLNARLFYTKQDENIVIGVKQGNDYSITDQLTQEEKTGVGKSDLKKVRVNNKLRGVLRAAIATLSLSSPDAKERLSAVKQMYGKTNNYEKLNTAFFGLSLGSVLVLAAIGLAITFGVMGIINMAHGELIMLGAYTTYVIQQIMPNYIGMSLVVAVPAAFVVSGLVGILIERLVIRHLYGRPLETLLATFGISLILQQAVRSVFSPLNRSVETPQWMSGSLEINPALSLTYNRLYIIIFCLAVFALLFLIIKKSSLGLSVRAVSQNRPMARAMGIRASRVDALTFGLGSGIAGIAGVALSQLTNVGPNLGQAYIIDSFMVVVFGGVGNLWGTLISGFSLGIANKFLEPWAGAVLAKILVLVFIILFIQKRPRGLFPQKGRAAES